MNIAFPALVLFLLALPGLIAYFVYIGRLRQSTAAVISTGQFSVALVAAIVISGVMHVVWVAMAALINQPVDLASVLALVGGPRDPARPDGAVVSAVTAHPVQVVSYFISIYVGAAMAGLAVRRAVRRFQLDHRFRALRYSNEWHYIFNGEAAGNRDGPRLRRADFVLVTVAADCADGAFLYVGLLDTYELDNDSDLRWLMLRSPVFRRRLGDDLGKTQAGPAEADATGAAKPPSPPERDAPKGPLLDGRYYEIAGDRFVVWSRDIRSLNVDYYFLDSDPAMGEGDIRADELAENPAD